MSIRFVVVIAIAPRRTCSPELVTVAECQTRAYAVVDDAEGAVELVRR